MKLLSRLMMPEMVIMRDIVIESYQMDTHHIDKMLMLTNMIVMHMFMENRHQVKGSNKNLVNH